MNSSIQSISRNEILKLLFGGITVALKLESMSGGDEYGKLWGTAENGIIEMFKSTD